ncbi:MAG: DUF6883 domain-containing protein [Cyanobacteria bacterium P01_C01_bin.69]
MKLPNGNRAQLGEKLVRYSLNLNYPKGKNKAILFQRWLGITLANKRVLEQALLEAAIEAEAILKKVDEYGVQYNTRFFMETDLGKSWVIGCWIVRETDDFPRLTNTYPVKK